MDMESLWARVYAKRAAQDLVSACGIACATQAEKAYRDKRHAYSARADWPTLPRELHNELTALHAAYKQGK